MAQTWIIHLPGQRLVRWKKPPPGSPTPGIAPLQNI
jgi:hypothetical protein